MHPTALERILLLVALAIPACTFAQASAPAWLEETLYGSGKMNAVIAVVAVILVSLGIWLFLQDRRMTRLEKKYRKE